MSLITSASATDIAQWANNRGAQERLPEVMRRLVHATARMPTYVDFPSGDSIQLSGPDGAVEVAEDHPFIPRGFSIWELSTDAQPKRKADHDYKKRVASPPTTARGLVRPSETTYVSVTARRWVKKDDWAASRRSERFWKDVRVLDADDLEGWLQQAPAVHVWLSRLMGRIPGGADDIETTWADWSEATTPATSTKLVLAGRAREAQEIVKWVSSRVPGTLIVSAESPTDALGVIAASILSLDDPERAPIVARALTVSNADSFNQLTASRSDLVVIPTFAAGTEIGRAVRGGHQVVVPSGPLPASTRGAQIVVPRVSRPDADRELAAMGIGEDRARELAGVARRSMLTLRRQLATHPSLQIPEWAAPESGPSLVPMLLAGQFDERHDADLQAVERLTLSGLPAFRDALMRWSHEIDPPVRRVGSVWYLVSKEDAWAMLKRYVSRDHLNRFETTAVDILREIHPKFDLPPDQRWAASIHGKERQYSNTLLTGIADTIALLGALGGAATLQGSVSPATFAETVVRNLFDSVASDWRGWATLSSVLPLLAEGAPDTFLRAVDDKLTSNEGRVKALFADEGDALFSSSSHTGLLWALEVLAWSPEHLAYSAQLLARLDRLDPGGRLMNRPRNSLRSVFLFWLPQTAADLETRLTVLTELGAREPESAWRLFASLLPRLQDHSTYNPRPKWRDWSTASAATYADIYRQTSAIVSWMTHNSAGQPSRWVTLIEAMDKVRDDDFETISQSLSLFLKSVSEDNVRAPLYDALRELLSRHRSFRKAAWALPTERLKDVEALFNAATPRDTLSRTRWLFSHRPQLPEGREDDWEAHQQLVHERRMDAAKELYSQFGINGVADVSDKVDRADEFGRVLALTGVVPADQEDRFLADMLETRTGPKAAFARGYASGWTSRTGIEIARKHIRDNSAGWSDETRAMLLLSQLPDAVTLDIADSLSPSGQDLFWANVYPIWLDPPVLERGLRGLLDHKRPHAAVDAAAAHLRQKPDLDPELLALGLEQAANVGDSDGQRIDSYEVGEVLDALERAVAQGRFDEKRLAALEFLYLPILDRYTREPRVLHNAMAKDPHLFVDAVRHAYRATGEDRRTLSETETLLAERSHHLLHTWREPPGKTVSGIDPVTLNEWVDEARAELQEIGRGKIGDQLIGQVMSGVGFGPDAAWPDIPVRDLVERLASEDFESGLVIGRYNSRGVISRDPFAGGDLERQEARSYERMAVLTAVNWERTSAMLRRMALSAYADANREDVESELREQLNE